MFNNLLEHVMNTGEIQDLINIQKEEAKSPNASDYMVGLHNGLVVAKATLDGEMVDDDELLDIKENMEEKEQWFEERTNKHIGLVKKAAEKIATHNPEFREFDGTELVHKVANHDASKFKEPERTPYIELTWQHKTQGRKYETPGTIKEKDINDATLHHIINNKHHPEYWNKEEANIDSKDRDKSVKCLDVTKMPNLAIAEMIADWQAMSEELGTSTARDWFNKQKDVRWHFNEHQVKLIDKLLKVFEK